MSREIKFRAWDGQTMRDVRSIHNVHSQVNVHADLCTVKDDPLSNKAVISSHYTEYNLKLHLMQYTGLKDKNGTPIYEGDIVLILNGNRVKREITWSDSSARFRGYSPKYPVEVIGNIWETPELLTNKGDSYETK